MSRELALLVAGAEARGIGRHDEATDPLRVSELAGLCPDHRHVGHRAVRDPHLRPVQHPAVGGLLRGRDHPAGVRAVVGLGQAETADPLAAGEPRQPLPALLFAAEGVDGVHDERALDRGERADAGVAALELLHDESVGDIAQPRAAVFLRQVGAEHPQLADLGDQLRGKATVDVGLADDRHDLVLDPLPHRVADHPLLFGQERVDVVEIDAFELAGHGGSRVLIAFVEEPARRRGPAKRRNLHGCGAVSKAPRGRGGPRPGGANGS